MKILYERKTNKQIKKQRIIYFPINKLKIQNIETNAISFLQNLTLKMMIKPITKTIEKR